MKKFLIALAIPPLTGLLGAFITEYVLKIGVMGTPNLKYFLIAGVVLAVLTWFFTKSSVYAVAAFIGCLLIPYMTFLIGQMDFYMVDDNLAKGISVLEVRPTMDKIVFGTPDKGDVVVWQGPQTLKLHPGENRVKLGRFDMPAGTYQGGKLHLGEIQVDIQADLSQMASPEGQAVPADKYTEVFKIMTTQMNGEYGGFVIKVLNSALNGNIANYTISTSMPAQDMPIPQIQYPGTGGPDITLDITLGPDGRPDPSKIKVILDMPPGVGPGMENAMPNIPGVEFR